NVILNKVMLDATFLCVGKNSFPINDAVTDGSHAFFHFLHLQCRQLVWRRLRQYLHVFHMNERETPWILFEVSDRVLSRHADPAQIHLHFYKIWMGILQ